MLVQRQKWSMSSFSAWAFCMRRLATISSFLFMSDESVMSNTKRIPPQLNGRLFTVTLMFVHKTVSRSSYFHLCFFWWSLIKLHCRRHFPSLHKGSKGLTIAANFSGACPEEFWSMVEVIVSAIEVNACPNCSWSKDDIWNVPWVTSAKDRKWCQWSDWEPKATAWSSKLWAVWTHIFCRTCLSKCFMTVCVS